MPGISFSGVLNQRIKKGHRQTETRISNYLGLSASNETQEQATSEDPVCLS